MAQAYSTTPTEKGREIGTGFFLSPPPSFSTRWTTASGPLFGNRLPRCRAAPPDGAAGPSGPRGKLTDYDRFGGLSRVYTALTTTHTTFRPLWPLQSATIL